MAQGGSSETFRPSDILRRCIPRLTFMISTSPLMIAMELHTQGVIGFEVFDRVQSTPAASSLDHATAIMTAVYKKVEAEGDEALGMFLEVLKRRQECAGIAISIERQRRCGGSFQQPALESELEPFRVDVLNDLSFVEFRPSQGMAEARVLPGTNDLSAPDPNHPPPLESQMNDLSISPLLEEVQPTPAHTSQKPCPSPVVSSAGSSSHDRQPHAFPPSTSTARSSSPIGQHSTSHKGGAELPIVANPCPFVVENFSHVRSHGKTWHSPLFYTHEKGYKLRLEISASDEHVSVYARLMKGEHDEVLSWPMCYNLFVSMLNWKNPEYDPKVRVISFTADRGEGVNSQVLVGEGAQFRLGFAEFISLDELLHEDPNTKYIDQDSIIISVNADVQVPPPTSESNPSLPLTTEVVPYTFAIAGFSKAKEESSSILSEPFLSHRGGYKLSLQVYPNGNGSGSGTHVSVFAQLNKGENDDSLDWPFHADVVVEIVNVDAKENYQQVIHFGSEFRGDVCSRVTKGKFGDGYGFQQYIAHSDLEKGSYVQDEDSLLMVVSDIMIYSFPSIVKRPTWYDSEENTLCGFTLPQFGKRKKYNRTYYSSPFFFPDEHGYKFRCQVYPNGNGKGRNNSVSCFLQLMRGKNDDDLTWPFRGQILIEILNWIENKHHVHRVLTFDAGDSDDICGRVLEGDIASSSLGYYQFVAHDDLPCNYSKGTQYVREDCVYWRIRTVPPKADKTADKVGEKIGMLYKDAERFVARTFKKVEEYID